MTGESPFTRLQPQPLKSSVSGSGYRKPRSFSLRENHKLFQALQLGAPLLGWCGRSRLREAASFSNLQWRNKTLLKALHTGLVLSEAGSCWTPGWPLSSDHLVQPLSVLGAQTCQGMAAISSRPSQTRRNTQNMIIKFISVGIISNGKTRAIKKLKQVF